MLKNDTGKNGTSCIGLYGSVPPPDFAQTVGRGRGNVIKFWSEITSGSSTIS